MIFVGPWKEPSLLGHANCIREINGVKIHFSRKCTSFVLS